MPGPPGRPHRKVLHTSASPKAWQSEPVPWPPQPLFRVVASRKTIATTLTATITGWFGASNPAALDPCACVLLDLAKTSREVFSLVIKEDAVEAVERLEEWKATLLRCPPHLPGVCQQLDLLLGRKIAHPALLPAVGRRPKAAPLAGVIPNPMRKARRCERAAHTAAAV